MSSKKSKPRFESPPADWSPQQTVTTPSDPMSSMNSNMLYLVIGAAGVSMGVSIFLYRELKKIKSEYTLLKDNDMKEQVDANTESLQTIETKLSQLAQNMQALHLMMKNSSGLVQPQKAAQPVVIERQIPVTPSNPDPKISEGGPVVIDIPNEEDCEEGVCFPKDVDKIEI